ncbi:hypothetical protein OSB04_024973 [Centaurea solstitialis]|uniref:Integrase catalytic domain-containing protein n=1 Tax=Centaurea solstitialis TaxID=347529 RepID=A0AA38T0K3_9ASTR|nr:hypothetical protein OSB04_024973 [Centaurea solstitialis]
MNLEACQHQIQNFRAIVSEKDTLVHTLKKDLLEANTERIRLSSECETANSSFTDFKTKFADLQTRYILQDIHFEIAKEVFFDDRTMYRQAITNQDVSISLLRRNVIDFENLCSIVSDDDEEPLNSHHRRVEPKTVLDPNIEYDLKVFLDEGDDPSGFVPQKLKDVVLKPEKPTESRAPISEKSNPKGEKCVGTDKGKSLNPLKVLKLLIRYTWVEFLRAKSEAADKIIVFIKQIQVQLSRQVKKIRSDNGTEFKNTKLQSFLEAVGITHNFSVVRTPQQNGVVERKNRTLIEAARSMMAHSGVPQSFWAKAVSTACYTQNRTLIVKRTGKTAYGYSTNVPGPSWKARMLIFLQTETYSNARPSNPIALNPDLPISPPSTDPPSNTFASDFIDLADYDLPNLTRPIIVPDPAGSTSTSVSSDAFVTEPSSSTSTNPVTPESTVSPPEASSSEPTTVESPEPVREQTTSPVLAPIPEEAPLPSPNSAQRTYA